MGVFLITTKKTGRGGPSPLPIVLVLVLVLVPVLLPLFCLPPFKDRGSSTIEELKSTTDAKHLQSRHVNTLPADRKLVCQSILL
jgi:hypothetical protein